MKKTAAVAAVAAAGALAAAATAWKVRKRSEQDRPVAVLVIRCIKSLEDTAGAEGCEPEGEGAERERGGLSAGRPTWMG